MTARYAVKKKKLFASLVFCMQDPKLIFSIKIDNSLQILHHFFTVLSVPKQMIWSFLMAKEAPVVQKNHL